MIWAILNSFRPWGCRLEVYTLKEKSLPMKYKWDDKPEENPDVDYGEKKQWKDCRS